MSTLYEKMRRKETQDNIFNRQLEDMGGRMHFIAVAMGTCLSCSSEQQ